MRVFVIWFDVLRSDDRSKWDPDIMADPRVVHLWDDERTIGRWFPDQDDYRELIFGSLAWDIYFLYGPEALWENVPSPLVSSGFTIIGKRKALQRELLTLLSEG